MYYKIAFLLIALSGSLPYLNIAEDYQYLFIVRDVTLGLVFLFFLFFRKFSTIALVLAAPIVTFQIYFIINVSGTEGYEFWQHFVRNLFAYSIICFVIFAASNISSKYFFSTIVILSIVGIVFEKMELLQIVAPDRFSGFFLGPGIAGALNILVLFYFS